ncbi:hydroxymethylglutaryl-CoA reductase, degradative [Lewinella cohaerens]|uniref:hydroxymethylglutaryl-CoA reductase, degradative n=1 Tax=Lewinella cohaerens TaxID=70995 RepID=UPI0003805230|nr:hydroxymethylglutaryl-CoA reductase, degradative [Lewinella cohaerens]
MQDKKIAGFSKMDKQAKIDWLSTHFLEEPTAATQELASFWHQDEDLQRILDGFSENTISNFPLPFGIAPNFMINGKVYAVPMVIEESSVVAAAASAAKFWLPLGGFHTEVVDTVKLGQLHFRWSGTTERWQALFPELEQRLRLEATHLTANMEKRGGGILRLDWLRKTEIAPDYYQLRVSFETCDSMGANFINSVLEQFGATLQQWASSAPELTQKERELQILMAILSNYTPDCVVKAWVECSMEDMQKTLKTGDDVRHFCQKFETAVNIAVHDPYRAVTHNKGIFNGIDSVVLATANDFRAIEACGHAYAARDGQYRSLSRCTIKGDTFRFELEIPLALGTVGGLTKLHPLAKMSLQILGQPSARELMQVIAATGLAQNFGALRSLVTTGIQAGHMKMHLQNILIHFGATPAQIEEAKVHFEDRTVSFTAVREFMAQYNTVQ